MQGRIINQQPYNYENARDNIFVPQNFRYRDINEQYFLKIERGYIRGKDELENGWDTHCSQRKRESYFTKLLWPIIAIF